MSHEIHGRVTQSEVTEKQLNQARLKYMPVATRGAVLYFVLADLAKVDVMYQYSLGWFHHMFVTCINPEHVGADKPAPARPTGAPRPGSGGRRMVRRRSSAFIDPGLISMKPLDTHRPDELAVHMTTMIERLTSTVYRVVSVGLFAHHQLMFSFMLCTNIMLAEGRYKAVDSQSSSSPRSTASQPRGVLLPCLGVITEHQWVTFLQADVVASTADQEKLKQHDGLAPIQRLECENTGIYPSRLRWITDSMWLQCQYLEEHFNESFNELTRSIISCPTQWDELIDSQEPYKLMGTPWHGKESTSECVVFLWECLSPFERVILLRTIRPDMVTSSVRSFVENRMGSQFVTSGIVNLRQMYDESTARTPLVFILSPGSDPGAQLVKFAREVRGSTLHLDMISLGQGQGPRAEELIAKAQILKGRWIFLQNCHLAASWMPKLQSIVEGLSKPTSDVDPQFRLWLSSKPTDSFPISILQMSLKMTVEPPQGVRANLLRSYVSVGEKAYEEQCDSQPSWKTLLVSLCFFNAVIHERKKYGRLGWNIPYEFNDSDLEVSTLQLEMLLDEHQDSIPWPALLYLTSEVTYGGRVTDDWDRRCLHSLLQKFYQPKALQTGYSYTADKIYHSIPSGFSYTEVKSYIEGLPASDSPELFGMNDNAEKAYLESQGSVLIDTILSVQPQTTGSTIIGSHKSNDVLVSEMASEIQQLLPLQVEPEDEAPTSRANQPARPTLMDIVAYSNARQAQSAKSSRHKSRDHNISESHQRHDPSGGAPANPEHIQMINQSALFTVLRQEISRFDQLLDTVHRSLTQLKLAVSGEIVMSQQLEEAYQALLTQKVPKQWQQAAYESCKPLSRWVRDLVERVDFFNGWADQVITVADKALKPANVQQQGGKHLERPVSAVSDSSSHSNTNKLPVIQPRSFWLSSFFFPQGFLTAVLQNHARKLSVSVDALSFNFSVLPSFNDTDESLRDTKSKRNVLESAFVGKRAPEEGVLVFGLYIDGAAWSLTNNSLCESLPGQRWCSLPEIHFIPALTSDRPSTASALESPLAMFKSRESSANTDLRKTASAKSLGMRSDVSVPSTAHSATLSTTGSAAHSATESAVSRVYDCPLYRTSARAGTLSSTGHSTNFVTSVSLPTVDQSDLWIMRGVALLCQLDD